MAMRNRLAKNNFDLVRLILAFVVCLVHSRDLSGAPALQWVDTIMSSRVAVESFFVISGFLIFMSYEKSRTLASYFEKRWRRLYPAYVAVVLLCAFCLLFVSTTEDKYFGLTWCRYLFSNLIFLNFLQPDLPGVFQSNITSAVNGALWSLKIEVLFYISVPIVVWLFRFGKFKVLGSLYVASLVWVFFCDYMARSHGTVWADLSRQLPGAMRFFVAGALIYHGIDFFERYVAVLMSFSLLVLGANLYFDVSVIYPLALSVAVCFVSLYGYLGNFGKHGDFSYGLYIFHFPILQLLISFGLFELSPFLGQFVGASLSMGFAVLTWHILEKRFIAPSSHYVVTSTPEPLLKL